MSTPHRTLTVLCTIPNHERDPLEVLWFNPLMQQIQGFSGLDAGADFYAFFEHEEQLHAFKSHLTARLHINASFLCDIAGMVWDVDVDVRDVLVLTLDRSHARRNASTRHTLERQPVELGTGQQILDMLPSPVFVKDREHRWVLGNQAFWELIGKNAIGFSDYDLFPKEQADVFWEKDEHVFTNRVVVGNEEQITSRDGSIRWLWTVKNPIDMPDGSTGLVGIITDITRRKLAEEQLVQNISLRDEALAISRSKSQFLAAMSHELRTPLNAILGYTELLLEEFEEEDVESEISHRADLQRIHKATYHLLDLTNDVLDLSRIERGEIKLELAPFRIEKLVQDCFETLEGMLARNQHFEFRDESGEESGQDVYLDRSRLRQVLLNLLGNAIKFTSSERITVTFERARERIFTLSVSDQGDGVSIRDHHKIFRPFERLNYENSNVLGTGLGLGLSRHLCRVMGGELDLLRHEPGEGATFMMSLPVEFDEEQEVLVRMNVSETLQDLNESRKHDVVLIEDPESALGEMLGMFSKDLSVYVLRCSSIAQLEELNTGKQFSLIVLDEPERLREELGVATREEVIEHIEDLYASASPRIMSYDRSGQAPRSEAYLPFPLTLIEWRAIIDILDGVTV